MVEMKKVLKKRKVAVEGMECHIKNPKNRFLTTISGDVVKDMVTVFVFFVFLVLVLVFFFSLMRVFFMLLIFVFEKCGGEEKSRH